MSVLAYLATLPDRIILALTIWAEARGEPVDGQIAVACVVRNRLRGGRWRDVCLAPEQFSCFNEVPDDGPVARAATALMTGVDTPALAQAVWIADGVMGGAARDNTHGATHYYAPAAMVPRGTVPAWAKGQTPVAQVGAQLFFKVA